MVLSLLHALTTVMLLRRWSRLRLFSDILALDSQQPVRPGICLKRGGAATPEQRQYWLHPAGGAVRL